MKLRDWFKYSDREKPPYNPTAGTSITFEIGWNSDDQFSFGDYSQYRDIKLYYML